MNRDILTLLLLIVAIVVLGGWMYYKSRTPDKTTKVEDRKYALVVFWPKDYSASLATALLNMVESYVSSSSLTINERQEGNLGDDEFLVEHLGASHGKRLPLMLFFVDGRLNMVSEAIPPFQTITHIRNTVHGPYDHDDD